MVKEIKKGKYKLQHFILDGDFGPKNYFELSVLQEDGSRKIMPFYPPFKTKNITKETSFFDLDTYTEKEYKEMLDHNISEYIKHYGSKKTKTK